MQENKTLFEKSDYYENIEYTFDLNIINNNCFYTEIFDNKKLCCLFIDIDHNDNNIIETFIEFVKRYGIYINEYEILINNTNDHQHVIFYEYCGLPCDMLKIILKYNEFCNQRLDTSVYCYLNDKTLNTYCCLRMPNQYKYKNKTNEKIYNYYIGKTLIQNTSKSKLIDRKIINKIKLTTRNYKTIIINYITYGIRDSSNYDMDKIFDKNGNFYIDDLKTHEYYVDNNGYGNHKYNHEQINIYSLNSNKFNFFDVIDACFSNCESFDNRIDDNSQDEIMVQGKTFYFTPYPSCKNCYANDILYNKLNTTWFLAFLNDRYINSCFYCKDNIQSYDPINIRYYCTKCSKTICRNCTTASQKMCARCYISENNTKITESDDKIYSVDNIDIWCRKYQTYHCDDCKTKHDVVYNGTKQCDDCKTEHCGLYEETYYCVECGINHCGLYNVTKHCSDCNTNHCGLYNATKHCSDCNTNHCGLYNCKISIDGEGVEEKYIKILQDIRIDLNDIKSELTDLTYLQNIHTDLNKLSHLEKIYETLEKQQNQLNEIIKLFSLYVTQSDAKPNIRDGISRDHDKKIKTLLNKDAFNIHEHNKFTKDINDLYIKYQMLSKK